MAMANNTIDLIIMNINICMTVISHCSIILRSVCIPSCIELHSVQERSRDEKLGKLHQMYSLLGCEIYNHLMEDILTP